MARGKKKMPISIVLSIRVSETRRVYNYTNKRGKGECSVRGKERKRN
jgi:hypothetical protein